MTSVSLESQYHNRIATSTTATHHPRPALLHHLFHYHLFKLNNSTNTTLIMLDGWCSNCYKVTTTMTKTYG